MRFRPKQPCCAFLDRIVTAKETSSDTKGEPHSKRRSYLVQNSRFDPVLDTSVEGTTNLDSTLYFVNNTVVNNRWNGFFIRVGDGAAPAFVQNNIFSGRGLVIDQPSARLSH